MMELNPYLEVVIAGLTRNLLSHEGPSSRTGDSGSLSAMTAHGIM